MYPLILILLLVACGTEEKKDSASEQSKDDKNSTYMQSMAIASKSNLLDCTAKVENQLVYVKDEAQFYVCEDKEWEAIEIGSKISSKSAQDDNETLSANQWKDPQTSKIWLIGSKGLFQTAQDNCSGKYRLPTAEEGLIGASHGLREVAKKISADLGDFWTGDYSGPNRYKKISVNSAGSAIIDSSDVGAAWAIFCIKD